MRAESDPELLNLITQKYGNRKGALIGVLQDIQEKHNFLPRNVLVQLAKTLDIPLSRIYSVATFYSAFSLEPRGKHLISACLGTACFVRGGRTILETIERHLGVRAGETTRDLKFSLEAVRCLGCCGLSPVIKIDNHIYGRLKYTQVKKILKNYK